MISQTTNIAITIFLFLFPLFYLPATADFYEYNKMALLVIVDFILLLLFSLKIAKERRITFVASSFTLPLFLITVLIIISTFIQTPNPIVAFTTPLGPTAWIAGFLFYLLLTQFLGNNVIARSEGTSDVPEATWQSLAYASSHSREIPLPTLRRDRNDKLNHGVLVPVLINILILDAVILSLYTIALFTGILPKNIFTPAGNLLATTLFIATIGIYTILHIAESFIKQAGDTSSNLTMKQFNNETILHSLLPYLLSLLLMLTALIILVIHLTTDSKPLILPLSFGWNISLEILKNIKTLLLGIGPTNFLTAFTLAKPISLNQTPVWNIIFTSSSSFFLTLTTEAGIFAAFLYGIILVKTVKLLSLSPPHPPPTTYNLQPTTYNSPPFTLTLLSILILQVFLPSYMSIFILTIIFLSLAADKKVRQVELGKFGRWTYLFISPLILFIMTASFLAGKVYLAETYFKNSLDAIVNNQWQTAYNWQNHAITLNPYLDRYHLVFSQVNLTLTNLLAGKKELTEEDKPNIPRLAQQSIDHARAAVTLYRTNVINWDNLAKTYSALINFAEGSGDWAETALRQKIVLDPVNPQNYLALGRFYFSLDKYEEAEKNFRRALALKQDFANGHYQLGLLLIQMKKYEDAYKELQTTYTLLVPDSDEAKRVEAQLAELTKLLPQNVSTPSAQISPMPLPTD